MNLLKISLLAYSSENFDFLKRIRKNSNTIIGNSVKYRFKADSVDDELFLEFVNLFSLKIYWAEEDDIAPPQPSLGWTRYDQSLGWTPSNRSPKTSSISGVYLGAFATLGSVTLRIQPIQYLYLVDI